MLYKHFWILRSCEQEAKTQLGGALLLQVLAPLQTSQLLVALFPMQCDCLLLLHALLKAPCQGVQ